MGLYKGGALRRRDPQGLYRCNETLAQPQTRNRQLVLARHWRQGDDCAGRGCLKFDDAFDDTKLRVFLNTLQQFIDHAVSDNIIYALAPIDPRSLR